MSGGGAPHAWGSGSTISAASGTCSISKFRIKWPQFSLYNLVSSSSWMSSPPRVMRSLDKVYSSTLRPRCPVALAMRM